MKIVTSFAPHRIERQQFCLQTWQKYDLPIVAVQSTGEAATLQEHFPGVEFTETSIVGDNVGKPKCPRVSEMCKLATDEPILIVNSDISIKDDRGQFKNQWGEHSADELVVGIRKDYIDVGKRKYLNPWGVDAIKITPPMVKHLADIGFCIGFPGWDYWIPWELNSRGYRIRVAQSALLHPVHDLGYPQAAIATARRMLQDHYCMPHQCFSYFIQHATGRTGMRLHSSLRKRK